MNQTAARAAVVIGINYEMQAGGGTTRAGLTRLRVTEIACHAMGAPHCTYAFDKAIRPLAVVT